MEFKNIVFFDLETTGVDVSQDRIVQICIIKFDENGEKVVKEAIVNPTVKIPKEASDVHGITDEMVKDKPKFKQIAKDIAEFIGPCDIAGYNSDRFDIPLLLEELSRAGVVLDTSCRNYVDVMKLEAYLNPRTLSAVYERYFGEELDGAHDATVDVNATISVLEKQLKRPEMEECYVPGSIDQLLQGDKKRVDFGGKLYKKDGEIYYNFGKHKDCRVKDQLGYAEWMLNGQFSRETKMVLSKIINS